ncbi:MAG: class I SAM-dependent methyltransferase [Promethearchaeota archaeon]
MENCFFNQIAKDYHLKRREPWRPFESFFQYLKKRSYSFKGFNIDLGCGNGRHFKLLLQENCKLIGIDNSIEFLRIANDNLKDTAQYDIKEATLIQIICADFKFIPIRTNLIQNIFSIATVHHIKNKFKRQNAIEQLFNLLRYQGFFLLTVWRKWQRKYRSYFFLDQIKRLLNPRYKQLQVSSGLDEFGDKIIPWTISQEKKIYNRFYHFFSKREIKSLLRKFTIKEFKIIGGPGNRDNFFILAQKI